MSATTAMRAGSALLAYDVSATPGDTVPVIAPFTGEAVHVLPHSTTHDVADAAAAARAAQVAWHTAGFAHRRRVLLRAHDLLLERRESLLDLLQAETGRARGPAFEELFQGANAIRYAALTARRALTTRRRRGGIPLVITTRVQYRPKQLVGVITPWNYPLGLALMDVAPALAAGCAVLQKADDQAALSVLAARRAFIDAGVPAALWPVVTGAGEVIGSALIDEVDHVCFTGSTATGTTVGARAAGRLIAASLELGGKNPAIVLDDVDPAEAAKSVAYACFSATGQLCVSAERVIVHRRVAQAFTTAFVGHVSGMRLGSALDYTTDVGSLASAAQLERVRAHVDDAVAKGATVLVGGRHRPDLGPFFYEPTVLTAVTEQMVCHGEETFGPVVALSVVDDDDEAVALANATTYGLNAAVFSRDAGRAMRLASRIEAGSVNINEGYRASFASIDAPMGGMRRSGLGRRNGPEGILRFAQSRTVSRATGLVRLPRVGAEFVALSGAMLLLLRVLKQVRRR